MTKFFCKHHPQNDVILSNNARVKFDTLDGLRGFFSTDNEYIHAEFLKCMEEQRYGISQITEAEYNEQFTEKKSQTPAASGGSWREEWGKGHSLASRSTPVARLGADAVAAAVTVNDGITDVPKNKGGAIMADPQLATDAPGAPVTASRKDFQPPVGQRKKKVNG